MKSIILSFLLVVILVIKSSADPVVALHHIGAITPFYGNNAFVDAYNASVNGDTIILPGQYFNPPSLIDKTLAIIGTGHTPDSTLGTNITRVTSSLNLGANADKSLIEGLYINGSIVYATNSAIDSVVIRRNFINGDISIPGDGTSPSKAPLIYNNIIMSNIGADNTTGIIIANNLIYYVIYRCHNGVIENNIFFSCRQDYGGLNWDYSSLFQITNSLIQNNIFIGGYFIHRNTTVSSTNNFIYNNLFTFSPNFLNNENLNNYVSIAQNTIFINQTGNTPEYTHDYHLKADVESVYIGTDASKTQVGIYGGYYPYKTAAVPFNPHISSKSISTTTDEHGKLGVKINVAAQQN